MSGKTVVFLPIIIFFAIFGLLIFGFLRFIGKLIKKSKDISWQGKVVDKIHKQSRDFDTNKLQDFYTVVFKTEGGKQIKIGVSKDDYEHKWQKGDKATKKKGKLWPKKV